MAAALRLVRRVQQVLLLPRMSVISVRPESGGKISPHTEISKTLVSFPVKVSHFQQPATGENRNEPLKPVKDPLLDVGESGGQSDRGMQLGQISAQNVSGTSHKDDDDSSSSSTSDSTSDSESEGEDNSPATDLQAKKGKSDGGHKGLPSDARKSSSSPGHMSLEKDSPIAEQKNRLGMRGVNAEDLQDFAPVVSTEEQSLHSAVLSALPGTDKIETSDETVCTKGASPTAAADSEEITIISTSEELPMGGVVTLAPESRETQLPPTSEELIVESVKMSAPESRKAPILLSTSSEELAAGEIETLAPEPVETQMLSTATSEELPTVGVETLAPESGETQLPPTSEELLVESVKMSAPESRKAPIRLSTTSEELAAGGIETLAPESVETQMVSTTASEELLVEEGAADLHESHSPMEPCVTAQEPFDNTKYQNLQHFTYTPFTFVDMDVEMAKYRLPQPSSGRPSPRH